MRRRGDGFAHLAEGHLGEAFLATGQAHGGNAARGGSGCAFLVVLDVFFHDAAFWARTGDARDVYPFCLGHALGERRGFHAVIVRISNCCHRCLLLTRTHHWCHRRLLLTHTRTHTGLSAAFFGFIVRQNRFDVLVGLADDRQQFAHGHRALVFHCRVEQGACPERVKLHRRLVGLDFCKEFTCIDFLAHFFVPCSHDAVGHRVAQLGHFKDFCHIFMRLKRSVFDQKVPQVTERDVIKK